MNVKQSTNVMSLLLAVSASSTLLVQAEHIAAKTSETTGEAKGECKVYCIEPHAQCEESKEVLEVLQKLVKAYSTGDIETYKEFLDDKCTTFNEGTKQLLVGKADTIAELQRKFEDHKPNGPRPLISFTIDQPYAKVTGDTCVVTFVAHKEIGGAHPTKEIAHITDIFIKRDDGKGGHVWKKMHWRGKWEPAT